MRSTFLPLALANRRNAEILRRMPLLGLTDWWLTAGCISQTVWNGLYGRHPEHGILDYDIFYFDADMSWEAENAVIAGANALFRDLPVNVEVRNQARVTHWYAGKFGVPFPPVTCAANGIDRFPCKTVAVGIRRDGDEYLVHAPFGLDLLLRGKLIPNPVLEIPSVYAAKTARWLDVWPELSVEPWPSSRKGVER